jgi:hypothetical protein
MLPIKAIALTMRRKFLDAILFFFTFTSLSRLFLALFPALSGILSRAGRGPYVTDVHHTFYLFASWIAYFFCFPDAGRIRDFRQPRSELINGRGTESESQVTTQRAFFSISTIDPAFCWELG